MTEGFCASCGRALAPDMGFCPSCGKAVHSPERKSKPGNRDRQFRAVLVGIVAIGVLYALSQQGAKPSQPSVSAQVTSTALMVQHKTELVSRINRLTADSVSAIGMLDLSDLVANGRASPDTAMLRMLQGEYEKRQRERRERDLLSEAQHLVYTDGSRCRKATAAKIHRMVERHASWANSVIAQVVCGAVSVGMTAEQVRASWGNPDDINRSTSSFGTHEQWVYDRLDSYVYLEDGVVTATQS